MANIKLHIRFLDDKLKTADDSKSIIFDRSKSVIVKDCLVMPIYALPNDIMDLFADEVGRYENVLYRYLYEASLYIDNMFNSPFVTYFNLTPANQFYIKRLYVIAWVTWQFAKVFYRDYLKSVKKSKFLADVKVSLEIEREPDLIKKIEDDAEAMWKAIIQGVTAMQNMRGFVKGSANPSNSKAGARLWLPSLGNNFPDVSMATAKTFFGGKIYKGGDQLDYGVKWNRANEQMWIKDLIQY